MNMFFINHNKRELHEERRTLIHQTDDMYNSYDSSNAHIYTEPQYMSIPVSNQQQQLLYHCESNKYEEVEKNQDPTSNLLYNSSNIGGLRKRHLSCIEEGDSDSLHSSSLPAAYEMMKDVDECFKQLVQNGSTNLLENVLNEDEETEQMAMIDESRLFELDYLDDLQVNEETRREEGQEIDYTKWNDDNFNGEMWQSTFSEPAQRINTEMFTNIMTTSCYGALNSSFGSESFTENSQFHSMSKSMFHRQEPLKLEPEVIYATPKKDHRDLNRSYNSPSHSHASSIYGLEQSFTGLMNTSLDLKCTSDSIDLIINTPLSSDTVGSEQASDKVFVKEIHIKSDLPRNLLDDFDAVAEKCLSGAENDLQSIRRLLDNGATNAVCPSCRISFDKGKRRKLIDTCGHERCYSCMFRNDQCPMCMHSSFKDAESNNAQGYDTGIGGSTSTIVSPLASPQPQLRSQLQRAQMSAAAVQHHMGIDKLPRLHKANSTTNSTTTATTTNASHLQLPSDEHTTHLHTITADVHYNSGSDEQKHKNNKIIDTTCNKFNATVYATPPTRRRFFNHKNLRSALPGHRRTSSNIGGSAVNGGLYDTTSLLLGGKDVNALNTSTCSDSVVTRRRRKNVSNNNMRRINSTSTTNSNTGSENRLNRLSLAGTSVYAGHLSSLVFGKIKSLWSVNSSSSDAGLNQLAGSDNLGSEHANSSITAAENQKDQLRMRLGLLLNNEQSTSLNGPAFTSSGGSSYNISPEQTLSNEFRQGLENFGSQPSLASKDDTLSLSSKFKTGCSVNDSYTETPLKVRKSNGRRSSRGVGLAQQRNIIYKPAAAAAAASVQLPLKPLFFEVPLPESDPPFIGRQWLLRELSHVLTATENPGVLINGQSGTGKTALILQLVEFSCFGRRKDNHLAKDVDGIYCQINVGHDRMRALASHIVGYHFCQADVNFTCLVPDFVHSLAAQLCQAPQLAAYREYLLNEPHLQDILSVKECIANAERVMRVAILEPLALLKRSGKIHVKTCLILIDALCEAEYHRPDHGHTIATFLAKMTKYFPPWLKVVATMRTHMLDFAKGLSYTKLSLDNWNTSEFLQKDMLDYISYRIDHSSHIQHNIAKESHNHMKFVSYLQALTQGSMLFAKMTLDLIERGQLVIKSTSYKVLPVSLAQIFLLHFNLRFPTTSSFSKSAAILHVCLATLYPLTLQEIYYTICATQNSEIPTFEQFLMNFKLLEGFLIKRLDNTYMFFHAALRDWLIRRDDIESTKFLCDSRLGHAGIALRLSRLQAPVNAEQTLELAHHMLKAHIFRQCQNAQTSRDMQSYWLATTVDNVSAALGCLRNVYSPNLKVSRLILLAGASPNYRTEFMGDAPILCISAHEGIDPMVSLLLEFGADVGLTNSQGCSPLILAAMRGHCDVVRLLVAAGSSLGQTDTTQRCALVHAARMGQLNVVKYLLSCEWSPRPQTADVELTVATHQALIAAAAQNHVVILENLLEIDDLQLNDVEITSGETALTMAARNGCLDSVAVLLARCAHIDICNKHGCSALWLAAKEGHFTVAEHLLQNGAQVDVTVAGIEGSSDASKKTPLILAAEKGHIKLLQLLLAHGAQLEWQDEEGLTALSWACLRGNLYAVKELMQSGSNKQHIDNNGRTALDLAAYQGSANLVQYLLEQGSNIEHIDVNGMRPLDRSIACRNIQVVQVFLRKGAKLGPNTWLMAMGKPEILVVLLNKLLEDGNVLYRKNRFNEAAHRYQYALRKISNLETLSERNGVFAQLRTNLLLNLSRCKRKLNELDESIDLASQAIAQKPSSYEGYYARAKARMEHTQLEQALDDANEALQKAQQSNVTSDVIEVLKRIQAEVQTNIIQQSSETDANNKYDSNTKNDMEEHEVTDL